MVLLIFQSGLSIYYVDERTKKKVRLWDYYKRHLFISKVLKKSKEKLRLTNYPVKFVISLGNSRENKNSSPHKEYFCLNNLNNFITISITSIHKII